jgi:S1-C subfamily serine protease
MHRRAVALLLTALCLAPAPASRAGDDEPDLQKLQALQKVLHKIITQVEPSVACILVSRSEAYQALGLGPDKDHPGQLGDFDPELFKTKPGLSAADRLALQRKLDLADPAHVPQAFGSGVVLDAAGLVLTNYHVVQDATRLYVRLPGGKGGYADIHAADPRSDLAVLRLINPKGLPLTPIRLGDADKMERGHFVLSIANVFAAGFRDGQPSASWGILSNIRRRAVNPPKEEEQTKPLHYYGTLLQTDARLHLGCSGGALVNLQGEMIGLTTALAAIQGGETPGGFAVPINAGLRRVIDVLKRGEEVEYGFLGVSFEERVPDGAPGVALSYVTNGSPAKLEGKLRERDVILAINDTPLQQSDDLLVTLGTQLAGSKVRLRVRRGKEVFTADVTLAKLYVPGKKIASSLGRRPFFRGLRVDYTSLLVQKPPRQPAIPPGVLVTEVAATSAADRALLKSGDIITHVNGKAVNTPPAFYEAAARGPEPLELTLYNYASPEPPVKVLLK